MPPRAPTPCSTCASARAVLRRVRSGAHLCKACFFAAFEADVLDTITRYRLFARGERVAVAVSGGKDSTVLAAVLVALNAREGLGLDLWLLSVDEGIAGYRDDSLAAVERSVVARGAGGPPLRIVSYKDLYGWSMDEVVAAAGRANNCSFCGVFRRQALDRGAATIGADVIATGHNADDVAETVFMNLLRGDISRLGRCAAPRTAGGDGMLPRAKPFLHAFEKEIVLYAHHARLDYVATECVYSPGAYRGLAREFLKELESTRADTVADVIMSAAGWRIAGAYGVGRDGIEDVVRSGGLIMKQRNVRACIRCGFAASGTLCQACMLLAGLNAGSPRLALRSGGGQASREMRDEVIIKQS
jgi:cytoplasmic tRNA 2-thiolation protein 1